MSAPRRSRQRRRADEALERDGFLDRSAGRGTFLREIPDRFRTEAQRSCRSWRDLIAAGAAREGPEIRFGCAVPPSGVARDLQLGPEAETPFFIRVLTDRAGPRAALKRYLHPDLAPLFDDEAAVARFQKRETSRELLRSMADRGIYGLAYWNNGLKQLSANQPLRNPADAAGLAFRIQPSPVLEAQFAAVDAKAVRLPFSEVSKAMQSGTVQGAEGPWSNIRGQSASSQQSYVTETNHGVLNYMLVTNSRFWTSIPFAVRSELDGILLEVTQTVNAEAASINAREREQLLAGGGATLVTLTPEQRQAWRAKMQPVWKSFEAQIGSDILRAALTVNRR